MKRMIAYCALIVGIVLGLAQPSPAQSSAPSRFGDKLVVKGVDYGDVVVRNTLEKEVKGFLNDLKGSDDSMGNEKAFKPIYTDVDSSLSTNPGDNGQRLLKYVQGLLRLRALKQEFAQRGVDKAAQRQLLKQWQELRQAEASTPHEQTFDWYAGTFQQNYAAWVAAQVSTSAAKDGKKDPAAAKKEAPKMEPDNDDEPKNNDSLLPLQHWLAEFWSVRNLAIIAATTAVNYTATGSGIAHHGGADASAPTGRV